MSRSVADFLYEETEFEIEYKKIFSDKVIDDNLLENNYDYNLSEAEKIRFENSQKEKKLLKLFNEFKNESNKFGFLFKLNFLDFCEFVGQESIFLNK